MTTFVLTTIFVVALVLYVMRRHARLHAEESL